MGQVCARARARACVCAGGRVGGCVCECVCVLCAVCRQEWLAPNLVLGKIAVQLGGLESGETEDHLEPVGLLLGAEEDQHPLLERTRAQR